MKLLLNKAHHPVTVLGPGTRVGLWLQGCTIRCTGCISRDTWNADPAKAVEVDEVLDWVRALDSQAVDGVTISGGEPFDQAEALTELLTGLRDWGSGLDHPVDLLCYSGRRMSELEHDFAPLLGLLDAVVPEPFVDGARTTAALRGSANQRLVPLSDLGRTRYADDAPNLERDRRRVQVAVDGESIWFIGIPDQGDMTRMRERAAAAGIAMRGASWLS